LKARGQTKKTEGTWQREGREPRWFEAHNPHNLGGAHRGRPWFQHQHPAHDHL